MQIAKFLGGESKALQLERDSSGAFVTSLDVGWINSDSGDTYGCQPSPGAGAEVKVHVIRGGIIVLTMNILSRIIHCCYRFNVNSSEWNLRTSTWSVSQDSDVDSFFQRLTKILRLLRGTWKIHTVLKILKKSIVMIQEQ